MILLAFHLGGVPLPSLPKWHNKYLYFSLDFLPAIVYNTLTTEPLPNWQPLAQGPKMLDCNSPPDVPPSLIEGLTKISLDPSPRAKAINSLFDSLSVLAGHIDEATYTALRRIAVRIALCHFADKERNNG